MTEEHNLTAKARDVLFYAKHYSRPDKSRPAKNKHILRALVEPFCFVSRAFHRVRALFAILLILGWATPAQFIVLSRIGQRTLMESSTRGDPLTYLALGDSTGLGLGAQNGYGYVEQLMTRIKTEHPGSRLMKLCRLGETTSSLRQRLAEGFSAKPTLVTLSIGMNDVLQRTNEPEFGANYEAIVEELKRLAVPIVITNLPDISFAPRLPNSMREEMHVKVLHFNKQIEAIAKRYHLFFVNLGAASASVLAKHQEFFAIDGFHPSDAGYRFWTRTMWPVVKRAIKESLRVAAAKSPLFFLSNSRNCKNAISATRAQPFA